GHYSNNCGCSIRMAAEAPTHIADTITALFRRARSAATARFRRRGGERWAGGYLHL
ncbi:MAG: hypothetical protein AVDCRST_MAG26-3838, partial [uncultured Chloroflexia bacterium]